ncbi:hypothetical protein ACA910_009235 [Epithemia clementina (nom. ined.)]
MKRTSAETNSPDRKQVRVCMALTPNADCLSTPPPFQREERQSAPICGLKSEGRECLGRGNENENENDGDFDFFNAAAERKLRKYGLSIFAEVPLGKNARDLTDGIRLVPQSSQQEFFAEVESIASSRPPVILPWVGFGTYKLASQAREATLEALEAGYRHIDTAFIYSREKTERMVGEAVQEALSKGILESREQVFITTKHWRKYHGYEASLECLRLSLARLKVDYVDLWLMHWPGPAWKTKGQTGNGDSNDPWSMASSVSSNEDMKLLRAETWRAMQDAYRQGKARAIGVCNFSVQHLQSLREFCTILPMVNQIELHPLHPQKELLQYCTTNGIVVEAYASLGGQDTSRATWGELLGSIKDTPASQDLLHAKPVLEMAASYKRTPAQVLLRWALQQNCVVIPKTRNPTRMEENAKVFDFNLNEEDIADLSQQLLYQVLQNNPLLLNNKAEDHDDNSTVQNMTRLCWRGDRFRLLDFD